MHFFRHISLTNNTKPKNNTDLLINTTEYIIHVWGLKIRTSQGKDILVSQSMSIECSVRNVAHILPLQRKKTDTGHLLFF